MHVAEKTLVNDLSIVTTELFNSTMKAEKAAARLVDYVKDIITENQRLADENKALRAELEKQSAGIVSVMPRMIQTAKEHAALLAFMHTIFGKDSADMLELAAKRYVKERDNE